MSNSKSASKTSFPGNNSSPSLIMFHATAMLFMSFSAVAGAIISGFFSRKLVTGGFHIIHAHAAFIGFGVFMVAGHLLKRATNSDSEITSTTINEKILFSEILTCAVSVFASFVILPYSKNAILITAAAGLYLSVRFSILCFQLYKHTGIDGLKNSYSKMSSRFFATSLFMMVLASGQLTHICINLYAPVLPFSGNLMLKHNYLAFSFPISLCIMGCIYDSIEKKVSLPQNKIPLSWNIHYGLLVGGVFALFFTILFSPWIPEPLPIFMSVFFSFVLVISILVFWRIITTCQKEHHVFTTHEWKYFISAAIMLALAGIAGLMLGYRWPEDSRYFYFFLQGHMHLALAGWASFGMLGTVVGSIFPSASFKKIETFIFTALHAGIILLLTGILLKTPAIRASGGIIFSLVFLYIAVRILNPPNSERT